MANYTKQFKACKYCGKTGLVWAKVNGRFILAEPLLPGTTTADTSKLHQCLGAPQNAGATAPTGSMAAQPNDQIRLTCGDCGSVILMRRSDFVASGPPICSKDSSFYVEGLGVEHAAA